VVLFRGYTELLFDKLAGWQHSLFANVIGKLVNVKLGMVNRKAT